MLYVLLPAFEFKPDQPVVKVNLCVDILTAYCIGFFPNANFSSRPPNRVLTRPYVKGKYLDGSRLPLKVQPFSGN